MPEDTLFAFYDLADKGNDVVISVDAGERHQMTVYPGVAQTLTELESAAVVVGPVTTTFESIHRPDFPEAIRGNSADAGLVAVLSQVTVAECVTVAARR